MYSAFLYSFVFLASFCVAVSQPPGGSFRQADETRQSQNILTRALLKDSVASAAASGPMKIIAHSMLDGLLWYLSSIGGSSSPDEAPKQAPEKAPEETPKRHRSQLDQVNLFMDDLLKPLGFKDDITWDSPRTTDSAHDVIDSGKFRFRGEEPGYRKLNVQMVIEKMPAFLKKVLSNLMSDNMKDTFIKFLTLAKEFLSGLLDAILGETYRNDDSPTGDLPGVLEKYISEEGEDTVKQMLSLLRELCSGLSKAVGDAIFMYRNGFEDWEQM